MRYCTRILEIDLGHRVYKHEGQCSRMHGHRIKVEVEACNDELDSVGRVIDYSVLKQICGGWLDSNWDHRFLVYEKDEELAHLSASLGRVTVPFNPTSENIAQFLFVRFNELMGEYRIAITRVRVYETPSCCAEYSVED